MTYDAAKLVDHVLGQAWRGLLRLTRCGRWLKEVAKNLMKPNGEPTRKPQSSADHNSRQPVTRAQDGMIDGAESYIHNPIVHAARNNPVHENDRDIVLVNDFGALRGSGQIFFGHDRVLR